MGLEEDATAKHERQKAWEVGGDTEAELLFKDLQHRGEWSIGREGGRNGTAGKTGTRSHKSLVDQAKEIGLSPKGNEFLMTQSDFCVSCCVDGA